MAKSYFAQRAEYYASLKTPTSLMTKSELLTYKSRSELVKALDSGKITEKQLRGVYSSFRRQIMSQVKNLEQRGLGFSGGARPSLRYARNLTTTRDLVAEIAEGLRFYHGGAYTVAQRRARKAKTIQTLQKHGFNVTESNFNEWTEFMNWFKLSEFSARYDSDSEVTLEVFDAGANAAEWERFFREWGR